MTSTTITRSCASAVEWRRPSASVATLTAVSKPNVMSVPMSLSIVFGTPTMFIPSARKREAMRMLPSPPIATIASRSSFRKFAITTSETSVSREVPSGPVTT